MHDSYEHTKEYFDSSRNKPISYTEAEQLQEEYNKKVQEDLARMEESRKIFDNLFSK